MSAQVTFTDSMSNADTTANSKHFITKKIKSENSAINSICSFALGGKLDPVTQTHFRPTTAKARTVIHVGQQKIDKRLKEIRFFLEASDISESSPQGA